MNFFFKLLHSAYFSIKFAQHNKFYFKKNYFLNKSNKIILTELVAMQSSQIPISYLLNILSKKFSAKIVAYNFLLDQNFFKTILWNLLSKKGDSGVDTIILLAPG